MSSVLTAFGYQVSGSAMVQSGNPTSGLGVWLFLIERDENELSKISSGKREASAQSRRYPTLIGV